MGASIGLIIFVPLYYEVAQHLSASDSGLALIPIALTTPGSLLSGRAMLHMRHYKRVPIAALIIALAALGYLIWQPAPALWIVVAVMSIIGIACGAVFPVCTVSIQNALPNHQVGTAMGAMNFFRALASAFAVAIMGAILLAGLGTTVRHGMDAAALTSRLDAPGVDIAVVFRWVFLAGEAFLAAALAFLLLMEERVLRGPDA
jgi:MFS family permease